jgi:hypothetical protein
VKTPQAIAILDSRDRLWAALDQVQEQVRVAEANLAKVKAGAKNGEIQAQKATIARSRVPIAATKSQRNRRSLREEKSIAAPPLQRHKPQLPALGPNSKDKFKPNKPQLPVYKPNSATPFARIGATGNCMNRKRFPLQLAKAKASPPKQPNSNSTKERQN